MILWNRTLNQLFTRKKEKTPKHFIAQILLRLTQESALELSLDPSDYLDDESDDDGSASCGSLQLMAVDVPAPHGPVMLLGDRFLRRLFFFLCGKSLENEYIFLLVGELAEFCGIYFCCGWSFQPWWSHGFFLSVFSAVKLAADLLNQTKATWWEKTSQWIFELFFRAFSWLFWERVTFWTFWRMTGILKMILEYAYFGHSC